MTNLTENEKVILGYTFFALFVIPFLRLFWQKALPLINKNLKIKKSNNIFLKYKENFLKKLKEKQVADLILLFSNIYAISFFLKIYYQVPILDPIFVNFFFQKFRFIYIKIGLTFFSFSNLVVFSFLSILEKVPFFLFLKNSFSKSLESFYLWFFFKQSYWVDFNDFLDDIGILILNFAIIFASLFVIIISNIPIIVAFNPREFFEFLFSNEAKKKPFLERIKDLIIFFISERKRVFLESNSFLERSLFLSTQLLYLCTFFLWYQTIGKDVFFYIYSVFYKK